MSPRVTLYYYYTSGAGWTPKQKPKPGGLGHSSRRAPTKRHRLQRLYVVVKHNVSPRNDDADIKCKTWLDNIKLDFELMVQ
jgi:hypothetical protein